MAQDKIKLDFDVVVVGAGIVGASAALVMKRLGYTVLLVDRSACVAEMPENVRTTALGAQAQELFTSFGVWQKLSRQQAMPYQAMCVWDENSQGEINFHANKLGLPELGFICDHFAVQYALQQQCEALLDTKYESVLASISQSEQGAELSFKDGTVILTSLLIAADGVSSSIRKSLDISVYTQNYQQTAIVAEITMDKPHQDTAWQRFLETGPLALLPLANGSCSIVWSAEHVVAEELLSLGKQDFERRLQSALQHRFGDVKVVGDRYKFPLRSVKANQYLHKHVLLIGDAAHGIHPLAGQGANLGLADVVELQNALQDQPNLQASRRFLRRYERARKVDNYATDSMMSAINSTFLNQHASISLVRGLGMQWLNKQAWVKQALVDIARRSD